jgi:flagellar biogenesis protein FliO
MFWSALRVLVALGLVLGVLFLMVRALQKRQGITKDLFTDPWIRLLTSRSIAPQKYVSLIEIGGEIFVLGISEAQITMLGKVENKAFAEQLLARAEEKPEGGFRFPSLLNRPKMRWPGLLRLGHGK